MEPNLFPDNMSTLLHDDTLTPEEQEMAQRLTTLRACSPSPAFRHRCRARLERHITDMQHLQSAIHTEPTLTPEEKNVATQLTALHQLTPSSAYRRHAYAQLQMRMQETANTPSQQQESHQQHYSKHTTHQARQRLATITTTNTRRSPRIIMQFATMAAAMMLLLLVGTGFAAAHSMPGEQLYPVKRSLEAVQMTFTPIEDRPALKLTLADRRLSELSYLVANRAEEGQLKVAAEEYRKSVEDTLIDTLDPTEASETVNVLDKHHETITSLSEQVSPAAQQVLIQARDTNEQAKRKAAHQAEEPLAVSPIIATKTLPAAATTATTLPIKPIKPTILTPTTNVAQETKSIKPNIVSNITTSTTVELHSNFTLRTLLPIISSQQQITTPTAPFTEKQAMSQEEGVVIEATPVTISPVASETTTSVPSATPTNHVKTAVPFVAATHTPIPLPPTSTPIPPTNTPIPPTSTPIPPTNTPKPVIADVPTTPVTITDGVVIFTDPDNTGAISDTTNADQTDTMTPTDVLSQTTTITRTVEPLPPNTNTSHSEEDAQTEPTATVVPDKVQETNTTSATQGLNQTLIMTQTGIHHLSTPVVAATATSLKISIIPRDQPIISQD